MKGGDKRQQKRKMSVIRGWQNGENERKKWQVQSPREKRARRGEAPQRHFTPKSDFSYRGGVEG